MRIGGHSSSNFRPLKAAPEDHAVVGLIPRSIHRKTSWNGKVRLQFWAKPTERAQGRPSSYSPRQGTLVNPVNQLARKVCVLNINFKTAKLIMRSRQSWKPRRRLHSTRRHDRYPVISDSFS